jgi:hypothetical protein
VRFFSRTFSILCFGSRWCYSSGGHFLRHTGYGSRLRLYAPLRLSGDLDEVTYVLASSLRNLRLITIILAVIFVVFDAGSIWWR